MVSAGFFVNANGGIVNAGSLQLTFPANSIQLNGQPYTGQVIVYAKALDVTSNRMFSPMPGELLGGMNDSLRLLRSFGMAAIELLTYDMQQLQLATGVSATMRFTIPSSLQANAPDAIDLWSFDEALGYWKLEGQAQKQGTQYIGSASHFSWWNCDVPEDFVDYIGTVNSSDGNPISNAQIRVISPTMGTGVIYTNALGEFNCRVPKNESLNLEIYLTCSTASDWTLVYNETILSGVEPIIGTYTAELNGYYPITGTVVNCSGQPVESGYVKIGSQIFITENGEFTIQACTSGVYILRGYDTSYPDSIKASDIDTVQVGPSGAEAGEFQTCTQVYGYVIDVDGNIYPTILIGNQVWMAENLKTTHFANGSVIPNVTDNTAWTQFITPAWCSYNNSLSNDSLYGKLYNWYTTDDFRNVCPSNWHVPTDADWDVLIGFIDEAYNPISNGAQSAIAGGKMKSISGWIPFTGVTSTNESGFSGLPGGYRSNSSGVFFSIGYYGNWWSSTEVNTGPAWYRYLAYGNSNYYRQSSLKKFGYSVRCIKD